MYQESENLMPLIENHLKIVPKAYTFYFYHYDLLRKQLTAEVESEKLNEQSAFEEHVEISIIQELQVQIKHRQICMNVISGDYNGFVELFEKELANNRLIEAQALLLSLSGTNNLLSIEIVNFLFNQVCNSDQKLPIDLKRDITNIFLKKVINFYLVAQDVKKRETYDEKGYLITQSELLSGGISNDQIGFFSPKSLSEIKNCAILCIDPTIDLEYQNKSQEQSDIFLSLIQSGQNSLIDEIVNLFQKQIIKKGGLIAHEIKNDSGLGIQIVRAAFAVMVKLNINLHKCFQEVYDNIDLMNGDDIPLQKGVERDQIFEQICNEQPDFQNLTSVWNSATKMLLWFRQKRQIVSEKISESKNFKNPEEAEHQEKIEIEEIHRIALRKAKFLIKLQPSKQSENPKIELNLSKKPSYVKQQSNQMYQNELINVDDTINLAQNENIQKASISSILSCLQAPVEVFEIQNQVENNYRASVRLYTGLYLLNSLLEQNTSPQFLLDAANCLMNLQKGKNLTHYMDGVLGGCNNNLEIKIRQVMFEILQKLGQSLATTQNIKEANNYLSVFQWQYQARDFSYLNKLNIFYLLSGKQGDKESLVSQNWANLNNKNKEFQKNLLQTFVEIYAIILSRITSQKKEIEIDLKLPADKNSSIILPNLKKVKSFVNESASSNLIDSAIRVIFRCFDTFCNQKSQIQSINDLSILNKFMKLNSDDIIKLIQSILNGEVQVNNTDYQENLSLNQINLEHNFQAEVENLENQTIQINTTSQKVAQKEKFESEFDWSKHFQKDKTKQVMTLPEEQFMQIHLNELETVQSHQHVLRKKQFGDNSGWNCDKLNGANQCRSGLTGFYQSSKIQGWQCRGCNYDLCIACMKVDKSLELNKIQIETRDEEFDWENFFTYDAKSQIQQLPKSLYNKVELKENEFVLNHKYLMEKTRPGQRSGWSCDSLHCKREERSQGWHSVQSNFDLCQDCMKVEKRIKMQIELIFQMQSNFWRKFNVSTIVAYMPSFLYQDVELENEEIVNSHKHPLTKHVPGGTKRGCFDYNAYSCNQIKDAATCKSGSSCSGIQGWRCYDCQFDLCINCLKVEKLMSQAPIELDISGLFQDDQNYEQLTQGQIKEIKTKISKVFTDFSQDQFLNDLINCVKLLSSISTQSERSSSILSKIVNPYYMRTLFQLLIEVSDKNKFVILGVLDDLIKLNIPLEIAEEEQSDAKKPIFEIKKWFDSQIADFLFSYAKKCASENKFQTVKIIIKSLQKFDVNLKPLLQELPQYQTIDQVLLLMLSNCGADIKSLVIGDEITLLNPNLPIQEIHTIKQIDEKNKVILFNQNLNQIVEKNKSQIQQVKYHSQKQFPFPKLIVSMIQQDSTSPIVKLMLINMLLERKTDYDVEIKQLTPHLIQNILDQFEKYSQWQFDIKVKKQNPFALDESEFLLFQDLSQLISNKADSKLNLKSFDNNIQSDDAQNRKNLVKSLFNNQIEKPQKDSFEGNKVKYYSSLYGIDDQLTLPYFIIGNEAMQNDFLQFYNNKDTVFPINPEDEKIQNEQADKIVDQCEIETVKLIAKQQIPIVEKLNFNFKLNFNQLLSKEVRIQKPKKIKQIVVKQTDCEIVYLQRSLQLVFETFDSSKVQDTDIMWHLAQYFIHLKEYNYQKGLQKQDVTKRWVEILQNSPKSFQELYVSRSINSLYIDSRKYINICNQEFKSLQIIIAHFKAASRLVLNNFQLMGQQYASKIIETILINISRIIYNSGNKNQIVKFQHQSRSLLHIVQQIVAQVEEIQDFNLYSVILNIKYLQKFIKTASKITPIHSNRPHLDYIYQFVLVAREIEYGLIKIQKKLKIANIDSLQQFSDETNKHIEKIQQFYEVLDEKTQLSALNNLKSSKFVEPLLEIPNEKLTIGQEDYDKWICLKPQNENTIKLNFSINIVSVYGASLLCISDEPNLNSKTQFYTVEQSLNLEISLENRKYALLSHQQLFSLQINQNNEVKTISVPSRFKHQPQIEELQVKSITEGELVIIKFILTKERTELYLLEDYGIDTPKNIHSLIQIQGFQGKVQKIDVLNSIIIIYNDDNIPFLIDLGATDRPSYFKDENEKIQITLVKFEIKEQNFFGFGVTLRNTEVTITGQQINETKWDFKIQEEGQSQVTFSGYQLDKKDAFIGYDQQFYFKLDRFDCKTLGDQFIHKFDIPSSFDYIDLLKKEFIAISNRQIYLIEINKKISQKQIANLPEDFVQITNILKYSVEFKEQILIIVKEKSNRNSLYRIKFSKNEQNFEYELEFQEKIETEIDLCFEKLYRTDSHQDHANFGINIDGNLILIRNVVPYIEEIHKPSVGEKILKIRVFTLQKQGILLEIETNKNEINNKIIKFFDVNGTQIVVSDERIKQFERQLAKPSIQYFFCKDDTTFDSIHLINPKDLKISQIDYCVTEIQKQKLITSVIKYDDEQLQSCIDFINQKFKQLKFRKLKNLFLVKQLSFVQVLNLKEIEGYDQELVSLIISANQFILDQKEYVMAKSHDFRYSDLSSYKHFVDKFALPHLQYFVQSLAQKSQNQRIHQGEKTFKFNRLESEHTLFEQLFKQIYNQSTKIFQSTNERPFRARIIGEGSYDAGGPFRDVMENICTEITDIYLQPTSNASIMDDINNFQPKNLTSIADLKRFLLIGKMIGWSINNSRYNLSLEFNVIFWKYLCKLPITIQDLKQVDLIRYNMLDAVLNGECEQNFEADFGDGQIVELLEGGSLISVTESNRQQFVDLYLQKYLQKDKLIYDTIIQGIEQIVSPQMIGLITPKSGQLLAFSTPKLNPDVLIAQVKIDRLERRGAPECFNNFKQMIREFSNNERQLLVKFITGSSRLGPGRIITILYQGTEDSRKDTLYPLAHTCGEAVDIWNYSSLEIMKERFRVAISSCGEIDADGDRYGSEDDSNESADQIDNNLSEIQQSEIESNQGDSDSVADVRDYSYDLNSRYSFQNQRDSFYLNDLASYGDEEGSVRSQGLSDGTEENHHRIGSNVSGSSYSY